MRLTPYHPSSTYDRAARGPVRGTLSPRFQTYVRESPSGSLELPASNVTSEPSRSAPGGSVITATGGGFRLGAIVGGSVQASTKTGPKRGGAKRRTAAGKKRDLGASPSA